MLKKCTFYSARWALLPLAMGLMLAGCGQGSMGTVSGASPLPNFSALVDQVSPVVVSINTVPQANATHKGDDDERWTPRSRRRGPGAPAPQQRPQRAVGSGFIISADGYILTNAHVVGQGSKVLVELDDLRQFEAQVVGIDKASDIALLKIDADHLPAAKIGDVQELDVGDWVMAIGSPFGLQHSVTAGIVSGKTRSLADNKYVPFIQTDTAINPGNSGGPLFNLDGEVVGINSQIYSRSGGYQGLSFATPINLAMRVAQRLRAGKTVKRGWLGVQIQDVSYGLAQSLGLQRAEGALVAQVLDDSPADEAGLHVGDVIIRFDGATVTSAAALPPLVGHVQPGTTVDMVVMRNGDKTKLDVAIGALQNSPGSPSLDDLGLRLQDIDAHEREQLGLDNGGVRVVGVTSGPGADAGLRPGDIIVKAGGAVAVSAGQLRKLLASAKQSLALLIRRNGQQLFLAFKPDN